MVFFIVYALISSHFKHDHFELAKSANSKHHSPKLQAWGLDQIVWPTKRIAASCTGKNHKALFIVLSSHVAYQSTRWRNCTCLLVINPLLILMVASCFLPEPSAGLLRVTPFSALWKSFRAILELNPTRVYDGTWRAVNLKSTSDDCVLEEVAYAMSWHVITWITTAVRVAAAHLHSHMSPIFKDSTFFYASLVHQFATLKTIHRASNE